MLRAALGVMPGVLLAARRGGAQDSTFLLTAADPARAPSGLIGNGRLGAVISPHGVAPARSYLAGLYAQGPGDVPRIAGLPAWNAIDVFDGTRWLDAEPASDTVLRAYRQTIDMRTGTARTSYDWTDGAKRTAVQVESFVSRADAHLAAVRLVIVPRFAGSMRVRFSLAGWPPPHRLALARLARIPREWGPAELWYPGHMAVRGRGAARAPGGGRLWITSTPEGRSTTVAQAATVTWPGDLPHAVRRTTASGDSATIEVTFDATPGRTYTFTKLVSTVSAADTPAPLARAQRDAEAARARGYSALWAEHASAWARRWETDIQIDGDPALQRVVRSMLFYLLCSADSGTAIGIPPMGLSSAGYYGHIFWDSDTWMFPALVLTHPAVARSMVAFRERTLDAARRNARANGFGGAMYPWEADDRGAETTPRFAAQNASSEIHVTGDVAIAQWQYYLATGDSAWLARDGFPVIRATADFWTSRATYDSTHDQYHVRNVVSVDEGLVGVTDDAYTNAVARRNLEIATAASRRLHVAADPRWAHVASRLLIPFDSTRNTYRTYAGAPDSTLGSVTPMLSYPLALPMNERVKRTNLEHGVALLRKEGAGAMMGVTLLSVVAAELGDRALLDTLLPRSYTEHVKGPFLMLSETPTNNAVNFLTGAGGFLQQVIFGYTGLRLGDLGLEPAFPPLLPSGVTRLVLHNVHVRGQRYDVVVDSSGRRIVPRPEAPPR